MKRILFGLGCTLALSGQATAQDKAPAARLGAPAATIRAQSPEALPAGSFDLPKAMPKGTTSDLPKPPSPLPMPGTPSIPNGPSGPIPPDGTVVGPTLSGPVYSGPVSGAPFASDPYSGNMACPTGGCPEPQPNWYVGIEALMFYVNGYKVPPLVSTGPNGTAGILSTGNANILYGDENIESNPRYGARLTLGYWFSPCWAVELNAFYTRNIVNTYTASTADVGTADLARPFFSTNFSSESSEIVSRDGVAQGAVSITTRSQIYGGELNARRRWWTDPVNGLDLIAGLRYVHLEEELDIRESVVGLGGAGAAAGLSRDLQDLFQTKVNFYGLQIGAIYTYHSGPWNIELRGKLAAGVNRSYVNINGAVTAISGGNPPDLPGGLLALSSNIGEQRKDTFSFIPEVGINIGYDLTSRLRIYGGYSVMYWSNVARPGDQIDRAIDENLLPDFPPRPPANGLRPLPRFETSNVWVQGFNFGFQFKW